MSVNMSNKDIRTLGYILRRTNYGEADRILNIITPEGKKAVIAKGVRKARSKLAGGIEMFTLTDYNLHFGRGEMGTLTGAKMVQHYGEIMKDYDRMELAGMMLKRVSAAADTNDNAEYFMIVDTVLKGLNQGLSPELVEAWFWLNLKKAMGEEVNLYRDVEGKKLEAILRYEWNGAEEAFMVRENGTIGADEIKMIRLMLTAKLGVVSKVRCNKEMIKRVLDLVCMMTKIVSAR